MRVDKKENADFSRPALDHNVFIMGQLEHLLGVHEYPHSIYFGVVVYSNVLDVSGHLRSLEYYPLYDHLEIMIFPELLLLLDTIIIVITSSKYSLISY